MIKCKICLLEKLEIEYYKCGSYKGKPYYRPECKECFKTYLKSESGQAAQIKYRNSPKGKVNKQLHKQNPEYKARQLIYKTKRKQTNILFRLSENIRNRTRIGILSKRWVKTTKFYTYIGCTLEDLKLHLEIQFTIGMTWDNYGEWHIDHIIPLASAKTVDELYKLCHYTNLQPLWARDNILKSNKILKVA